MHDDAANGLRRFELLERGFCLCDGSQFRTLLIGFSFRHASEILLFRFDTINEFSVSTHFQLAHLLPDENCAIGIGLRCESTGPRQHGTEPLSGFNSIRGWMLYLAFHCYGRMEIIPLRNLANGQDIAIPQSKVCIRFAGQCRREHDLHMLIRATTRDKPRQVGAVGKRAALQSTGDSD